MENQTKKMTVKEARKKAADENPCFSNFISGQDGHGYRDSNIDIFVAVIDSIERKISPLYMTYHVQGMDRYRVWTEIPPRFFEGLRPDYSDNKEIAVAELETCMKMEEVMAKLKNGFEVTFFNRQVTLEDMYAKQKEVNKIVENTRNFMEHENILKPYYDLEKAQIMWAQNDRRGIAAIRRRWRNRDTK